MEILNGQNTMCNKAKNIRFSVTALIKDLLLRLTKGK
jgi:hypothetical protein